MTGDQADIDEVLCRVLDREATLQATAPKSRAWRGTVQEYDVKTGEAGQTGVAGSFASLALAALYDRLDLIDAQSRHLLGVPSPQRMANVDRLREGSRSWKTRRTL